MDSNIYVVAGNSANSDRYWYKIYRDIKAFGWQVFCVNPKIEEVDGSRIYPDFKTLPARGNVLILVARPEVSAQYVDAAIDIGGYKEVWFQPGTYSESAAAKAEHAGMHVRDECFMMAHSLW